MTKTSRSSSRSAKRLFAVASLSLVPFGPVPDLLKKENPWHGFTDKGPVLTVIRAQKLSVVQGNPSCDAWIRAIDSDAGGAFLGQAASTDWAEAVKEWQPWREDDARAVSDCDSMPCEVKLNEAETTQMAAVPKPARRQKFDSLVLARVHRYQKTQERKEYEFPGDPVDPWEVFASLGLKSTVPMPSKMDLRVRKVDLAPGRVRAVRQVVDRRSAASPDKSEATLWRRDVYTDHYFDSWGEWADVRCDAGTGSAVVTLAVMLELDLMKKTDLVSRMMRSKMRGATQDNGEVYLDNWFKRLRLRASAGAGT